MPSPALRPQARAYLDGLFGRKRGDAAASAAADKLIALLDASDAPDDDLIAAVRDALGAHVAALQGRPLADAELDAAVLALMLRHRDDAQPTRAASVAPAAPRETATARPPLRSPHKYAGAGASPAAPTRAAASASGPLRHAHPARDSPRFNAAAMEFKPRDVSGAMAATAGSAATRTMAAPCPASAVDAWVPGDASARDQAGAAGSADNEADDEDDEADDDDEFSPFARGAAAHHARAPDAPGDPPWAPAAYAPDGALPAPALSSPVSLAGNACRAPPHALSPLQVFCDVLVEHNAGLFVGDADAAQRIQGELERNNYDVQATLQLLRDAHRGTATTARAAPPAVAERAAVASGVHVVSRDAFFRNGADTAQDGAAGARICRYFMAGECRRSDCRFSHDVNRALCRFWLRGQCLNDPCSFLHDLDALSALASSMSIAPQPVAADSGGPAGAAQRRGVHTAPAPPPPLAAEPLRAPGLAAATSSRWTAAVQRTPAHSAQTLVARGAAATVPMHAHQRPVVNAYATVPAAARPSLARRRGNRVPLRPPTLIPTLSTGTALASEFGKLRTSLAAQSKRRGGAADTREEAAWKTTQALVRERHTRIREQLLVAAGGDAGGWGGSAQASDEPGAKGMRGQWLGANLGVCLGVARPRNVAGGAQALSLEERAEALLDMHGLHAAEAVQACEHFLLALEQEGFRGLAFLGVGTGKHTDGRHGSRARGGKVAGLVGEFLRSWEYPHADYDGMIACDALTHL
ncbi:hypothetical protein MSPP1_000091 [Malassezia sp. CBS 17886]|nr:hypothetical protein MSPP1_000091 [Malassezia sp. CBS 17886]